MFISFAGCVDREVLHDEMMATERIDTSSAFIPESIQDINDANHDAGLNDMGDLSCLSPSTLTNDIGGSNERDDGVLRLTAMACFLVYYRLQ